MAELPAESAAANVCPPARLEVRAGPRPEAQGRAGSSLSVPEFKNQAWAYVPERYDPAVPHGVVVWLHGTVVPDAEALSGPMEAALRCRTTWCSSVPRAGAPSGWQADEVDYVEKLVGQVKAAYTSIPRGWWSSAATSAARWPWPRPSAAGSWSVPPR